MKTQGLFYKKIGLLHHIGGGNLGDDATQDAVMQNIKKRWPNAMIIGLSMNPEDTRIRHGILSYPIRRKTWSFGYRFEKNETSWKEKVKSAVSRHLFLFKLLEVINSIVIRRPRELFQEIYFLCKSFRVIGSLDLLIINGGGQLTEWGGPWEFPYTLFKWIMLAKLSNVKSFFLNVGAGPLTYPLSKFFIRHALRFADYTSFRDEESRTLVYQIGFKGRGQVFPDSAYGLAIPANNVLREGRRQGKTIVGIAPMPYCDPRVFPEKEQDVYEGFIRKLGLFCAWLTGNDYSVTLFGSDIGIDTLAIADLQSAISSALGTPNSSCIISEPVTSTQELLVQMSLMDYVVTCRFHGVIFAHMLNKPVLAISHHPKVAKQMKDIGLDQFCVDIRMFSLKMLKERFESLVTNRDEIRRQMTERLSCYKNMLAIQFDGLFPMEVC